MSRKFNLDKPIVVADSGLLSKENIKALEANGYEYILGARVKNESEKIKGKIPAKEFIDGMTVRRFSRAWKAEQIGQIDQIEY